MCCAVTWVPDQDVTLVTGKGLSTGCKQFVAVGMLLPVLQEQGVISNFYPVSSNGAYRVVLSLPTSSQNA